MVESRVIQFSELVNSLGQQARAADLSVPVFRSPPRVVGLNRTIRWRSDGRAVVAVAYRNRPVSAVIADLIEAIVVVNGCSAARAARLRDDLWHSIPSTLDIAA